MSTEKYFAHALRVLLNVDGVTWRGQVFYPYEVLVGLKAKDGIDINRKEMYLTDADFEAKFSMPRDQFYRLPKFKQVKAKRDLNLL